ncbi:hypothetical protein MSAN_00631200 [Mycena sanguinolenta]|uniref:Uncharacterized protein n=1 Tax=Mycena sanguinolenta TaxID=230812 RepID=A0A8H6Z3I0_9AGAR|nr:hypothetical protein MSAN_00631200 [Mycena sanguinolenta]
MHCLLELHRNPVLHGTAFLSLNSFTLHSEEMNSKSLLSSSRVSGSVEFKVYLLFISFLSFLLSLFTSSSSFIKPSSVFRSEATTSSRFLISSEPEIYSVLLELAHYEFPWLSFLTEKIQLVRSFLAIGPEPRDSLSALAPPRSSVPTTRRHAQYTRDALRGSAMARVLQHPRSYDLVDGDAAEGGTGAGHRWNTGRDEN